MENTKSDNSLAVFTWDHLHIRGEHVASFVLINFAQGSPPHTWRTLDSKQARKIAERITSTYVENTGVISIEIAHNQDHLHIRGEHFTKANHTKYFAVSPPHTWRTHLINSNWLEFGRITSTYVENTLFHTYEQPPVKDHLHIRGEHGMGGS